MIALSLFKKLFPSKKRTLWSNAVCEYYVNCENDYYEVKLKYFLHKMMRDFGLNCFTPRRRRSSGKNQGTDDNCDGPGNNLEHNKAWLLAESVGSGVEEPHSVPSFRFNFCSQIELESVNVNSCLSSAVVLMVNLDNGSSSDSNSKELKRMRIESLERSISTVSHSLIKFSYAEILSASRNFSRGRVLGREALNCVFRGRVGFLRTAVAIKRLDKEDKESPKAFCRELMISSSLHSQYIVPLVGYCIDPEEGLFLVYKYVSGGSLERFLHEKKRGGKAGRVLPWSARYKIAVGVAEAIGYLHSGTERCVVHRDIKPSTILLSSKKAPKLHDFGLATWTPAPSVPFLCKTVKGTFGYLAPEYFQHGKVSDKTDVYAFGVVLLELITGRKPIEAKRGPSEENLVSWAKPLLQQGAVENLLDPCLRFTTKNANQIAQMVQAAAACLKSKESHRPEMGEIIAILRGIERHCLINKKVILPGNNSLIDCYPQFQQIRSEMKTHVASAMLGVEFDDEDQLCSW